MKPLNSIKLRQNLYWKCWSVIFPLFCMLYILPCCFNVFIATDRTGKRIRIIIIERIRYSKQVFFISNVVNKICLFFLDIKSNIFRRLNMLIDYRSGDLHSALIGRYMCTFGKVVNWSIVYKRCPFIYLVDYWLFVLTDQ
jgi:hypothetical protein